MGWRWRKVVRTGPVNTTVTTKGVGWSIGVRGLRYGISPTGRRYVSVGVPGTGLYWTKYLDGRDPTKSWRKIDMEQTPFEPGKIGFADNPEPRCASVLLLDVSGSMQCTGSAKNAGSLVWLTDKCPGLCRLSFLV
jgi:hypothetical protein